MDTKLGTQQMCDVMIRGLSWIDEQPDIGIIPALKEYRQKLIDLPNTVVEGQSVIYPEDPRETRCC